MRYSAVRCWAFGVGRFSVSLINVETAGLTSSNRAGLRTTIAGRPGADQALACRAPHDVDGDRRHAAFHRAWLGDRNFLWLYPAVSAQDVVVDCSGVGLPLQ